MLDGRRFGIVAILANPVGDLEALHHPSCRRRHPGRIYYEIDDFMQRLKTDGIEVSNEKESEANRRMESGPESDRCVRNELEMIRNVGKLDEKRCPEALDIVETCSGGRIERVANTDPMQRSCNPELDFGRLRNAFTNAFETMREPKGG